MARAWRWCASVTASTPSTWAATVRRLGLAMPDIPQLLIDPFMFPFMQRALAATLIVGVLCAVVGAFVVWKGLSFVGDALAHASFAGVAIAFVSGTSIYLGAAI